MTDFTQLNDPEFLAERARIRAEIADQGDAATSAELAAGYRAARVLQSLAVPSPLAKQVANYICRADAELAARGISADKLTEADNA